MSSTPGTWLVLGASSPVARAFAREAGRDGHTLVLSGRHREDLDALAADVTIRTGATTHVLELDVGDMTAHAPFVERCLALRSGPLSVFIATGTMPPQEQVESEPELMDSVGRVNYVGPAALLTRFVPVLEEQGRGAVVVLGSVAGDRGRRTNYAYGSAKAGLHTYLQGLRARLSDTPINVTTVKPGFVDTSMTWGLSLPLPPAAPEDLARACWRHAHKGTEVTYQPPYWRPIMAGLRALPEGVFKRLRF